ncbi:MAG: 4'-phosphopantetheinyl transferase superfamily protein [Vicinamibacteria bacterium]
MIAVGNDVVDLEDPESRLDSLHPRWVERVFAPEEKDALAACATPLARQRLHWALWAAKESAFKARRRLDRSAVFSPREAVVVLPGLPDGDGVVAGHAHDGEAACAVEVRFGGSWVHAVAVGANGADGLLRGVASLDGEPGPAARAFAAERIGAALGLGRRGLRIDGRPPVAFADDRPVDGCVSLSHHGRFVAFAFAGLPSA